jgi:death on curing protein
MVVYLTLEQVRRIHHAMIQAIEGEYDACLHPGIYENLLAGCLDRPQTTIHNYTPYPDIFLKAASLLECIISTNSFIDGSKRTGFLACDLFLEQNGYYIDPKARIKRFLLAIARNEVELTTIADWLQSHALQR